MRKFIYIAIISIVYWSCGGGGGDDTPDPPPPAVNEAPSTPTQSTPTNNQLCIDNTVQFQWNASTDPEGDAITYELQIATNNQFSQNLQTITSSNTTSAVTFGKGIAYYWRIKAKDNKNASSSYSSVFNFYTEGEGESNHLPFSPAIVAPELNALVQESSTDLSWTASDVDNDPLTFDVYFDTVNPPTTKISENQSETTFNQALESSKNYYWKVVVKDDKGGETIGQIWNFITD